MKKILLVDDKSSIAKVLSMYLGGEYELIYQEDPLKAIEWLQSTDDHQADLIISDIRMPHMTGGEFLHYLKSNEFFKDIPVIILSSEESTSERIHLLQEGAADYILKPFSPMELKIRIGKYLNA